jgi:hypothetical protein
VDVRTDRLLSGPYRTSAEQLEEQAEAQLHGQITPMGGSAGFIIYDAGGLSFLECVGNANRPLGCKIQRTACNREHKTHEYGSCIAPLAARVLNG